VVCSSSNFSRVLLLTDHSSGIDALVQDNRARGIVEGAGVSAAILNYVAKEYPVRVGDVVVTSGMDGVFPKGIIIGSVSQVGVESGTLLQNIAVKPAVDFSRLEEVLIVTANQGKRVEAATITEPFARRSKEDK
jgi:rod shape-determining protein MreC